MILEADVTPLDDSQDYTLDPKRSRIGDAGTALLGGVQKIAGKPPYNASFYGKQKIKLIGNLP